MDTYSSQPVHLPRQEGPAPCLHVAIRSHLHKPLLFSIPWPLLLSLEVLLGIQKGLFFRSCNRPEYSTTRGYPVRFQCLRRSGEEEATRGFMKSSFHLDSPIPLLK